MKKRRLIIGMFLLFAFLGLGIGYAALSNSLTVTGITSAGIDDNNLNVVFEHDASTYATSGCTVYDLTEGTKSARVRVNADALKNLGDVAWAKIKVTNKTTGAKDATLDATLSQPTITPSGFAVTADPSDAQVSTGTHFKFSYYWVETLAEADTTKVVDADVLKLAADNETTTGVNEAESLYLYIKVELITIPTEPIGDHTFYIGFDAKTA